MPTAQYTASQMLSSPHSAPPLLGGVRTGQTAPELSRANLILQGFAASRRDRGRRTGGHAPGHARAGSAGLHVSRRGRAGGLPRALWRDARALLIEGQERRLRAWDFVHCPAWIEHVFVGAGDGPCAILAVGTRLTNDVVYPDRAGATASGRRGARDARATAGVR